MSYVVAIDVGIKNLGLCVYDFITSQVVHWETVSLATKYQPMLNVRYVREFVESHAHYFEHAQTVLVERQMRCNMRIIEAVFHTLFYDTCIILNPRSVKLHYGLCMHNYRANKERAVEWATDFVESNPRVIAETPKQTWTSSKKRDDLADALLLVMYYLDTYSNQLED